MSLDIGLEISSLVLFYEYDTILPMFVGSSNFLRSGRIQDSARLSKNLADCQLCYGCSCCNLINKQTNQVASIYKLDIVYPGNLLLQCSKNCCKEKFGEWKIGTGEGHGGAGGRSMGGKRVKGWGRGGVPNGLL
jgi:hypothetical protein